MLKALLCLVLLFASCSSDEPVESFRTDEPNQTADEDAGSCVDRTPPAPEQEDEVGDTKPKIKVPEGDPPCDLIIHDIHAGDGDEAEEGGTVTIQYVGVSWSTGEEFDSSWEAPEPVTFELGQLIPGWQEGIPGMKEGGRRRLIIPPELAYGDQPPPGIAPNETLVFIIDLIKAG